MNMHDTASVFIEVSRISRHENRPFRAAASVAQVAPTAELSTRLVTPNTKRPVMKKKMAKGMIPAFASASFSPKGMFSSSSGTRGASLGFSMARSRI